MSMMRISFAKVLGLIAVLAIAISYAEGLFTPGKRFTETPRIDLISSSPEPFHQKVIDGARDAAKAFNVDLAIHVPDGTRADQTKMLSRINIQTSDGIVISPLDPDGQVQLLSQIAAKVHLVTYDNDSPQSLRHYYVGTNNYAAGGACAALVREALPDGGKVAIFIGYNDRDNARDRRLGFINGLLGLNNQSDIPLNEEISNEKYTVTATYLDEIDMEKAKNNALRAIEEHPDLKCMVAMYAINGPMCLEALKESGKLGDIKIAAFDGNDETLQGIADGHILGTIVQNPYRYGYDAIRILASLHREEESLSPMPGWGYMFLQCRLVKQENLEEYRAELKRLTGTQ